VRAYETARLAPAPSTKVTGSCRRFEAALI
jgi:hypothetical protein